MVQAKALGALIAAIICLALVVIFLPLAITATPNTAQAGMPDTENQFSKSQEGEVVVLLSLSDLREQGLGTILTIRSLETGEERQYNTRSVQVLGETREGEGIDYNQFLQTNEGQDPIGMIGKIILLEKGPKNPMIFIRILPFYPWWQ